MSNGKLDAARVHLHRLAQSAAKPLTERLYAACLVSAVGAEPAEAFEWVADARANELTPLQGALLLLLEAGAAGDATRAEEAACSLEELGARHRAIGAHQLAERLHTAQGRPQHARRCAERAAALTDAAPRASSEVVLGWTSVAPPSPVFVSFRNDTAAVPSIPAPPPSHAPLAYLETDTGTSEGGESADLSSLTRRELEVGMLIAQGLSNQEIATRLFLSVRTVESHVLQARTKVGAGRRRDLGRIVAQSVQREA
nr:helix-turn-helix transcriptional regulator [Plantibacter sp. VKM Ac-2880]